MARTSLRWSYPSGIAVIPPASEEPEGIELVQAASADSDASEVASQDVTLPVTATAGNLIVVVGNSDATISTPGGFSLGESAVNAQGLYLFYKVAAGGEQTVALVPSVSRPVVGGILEYSGIAAASPLDQTVTTTDINENTTGPVSAGTTGTTTVADELVLALTGPHAFASGAAPNTPTWTNGYVTRIDDATLFGTNSRNTAVFVGELIVSSTGTQTTATSWTNAGVDYGALIVTFKGA